MPKFITFYPVSPPFLMVTNLIVEHAFHNEIIPRKHAFHHTTVLQHILPKPILIGSTKKKLTKII
ncbi:hypothetical protein Hanom_Chr01g00085171 [Helianthus anomalus]